MARKEKEVAKTTGREVSDLSAVANFFEEYGAQASSFQNIVGKLLRFSKGDYLAGQDNEEVKPGTEVVACMDTLQIGWIKWLDQRPARREMVLALDAALSPKDFRVKKRDELDDPDRSMWELDASGKPRDPWQFTNELIMRPMDWDGDDANLYTFSITSKGGVTAIGNLAKFYGKETRLKPDEYPVIALGVDSYLHPNKEFGRIKIPVLTPTGEWSAKEWKPKQKRARRTA
jgi:hypothetical protein